MSVDIHSVSYAYQECEKLVESMRLTIHMHVDEVEAIRQFLAERKRPPIDGTWRDTYACVGFRPSSLQGVIVQFALDKEEGFPAAEPVLEFLLSRGWNPNGTSEDADFGNREYRFTKIQPAQPLFWPQHHEWKPYSLTATVRVWPHAESAICRKVQVGTKPEYKFECAS